MRNGLRRSRRTTVFWSTLALSITAAAACARGVETGIRTDGADGSAASTGSMAQGGDDTPSASSTTGPSSSTASSSASAGGSGDGGAAQGTGGSGGSGPLGSLELEYLNADTDDMDGEIKPHFNLKNIGSTTVPLSEVKIRYFYSMEQMVDTQTPQVFICDYASVGSSTITGTFGMIGNTDYLEVGFTTGSLAAGDETGEIQARFNWTNFTVVDETNDYSFDATKTTFQSWNKVTAYHNGALIWGIEPP